MWIERWMDGKPSAMLKACGWNHWEVSRQVPLSIPPDMAVLLELDFWNI